MSGKIIVTKGGPGSGNHGHAGRPGKRGGSAPGGGTYAPGNADFSQGVVEDARLYALLNSNTDTTDLHDYDDNFRTAIKYEICKRLAKDAGVDYDTVNAIVGQWAVSSNDEDMRSLSLQEAASEEFGTPLSDWQRGKLNFRKQTIGMLEERADAEADKTYDMLVRQRAKGVASVANMSDEDIRKFADETRNDFMRREMSQNPKRFPITTRENERKVLRAMYNNTQKAMAEQGLKPDDYVTLYRGMTISKRNVKAGDTVGYIGNAIESWSVSKDTASNFGTVFRMRVPRRNIVASAVTGFGCLAEYELVIIGSIPGTTATVVKYKDPYRG